MALIELTTHTHTHRRVHAPHTTYTPHTRFFQAKLQAVFSTFANIFSDVIEAPTLGKGKQSPLKGSPPTASAYKSPTLQTARLPVSPS